MQLEQLHSMTTFINKVTVRNTYTISLLLSRLIILSTLLNRHVASNSFKNWATLSQCSSAWSKQYCLITLSKLTLQ